MSGAVRDTSLVCLAAEKFSSAKLKFLIMHKTVRTRAGMALG